MELLYHPLIIAIFTIIWEVLIREPFLKLFSFLQKKRIRKKLFEFQGDLHITKSFVPLQQQVSRESDNIVEKEIERQIRGPVQVLREGHKHSIEELNSSLIVIGSPKYNKCAELLQRYFSTQFEYVFDLYEGEPVSKVLKIVNQYGDEYISSSDFKGKRTQICVDYGILFHARLKNNKRILWISGIHGPGTLGVYKYLIENPDLLIDGLSREGPSASSWFFRIKYDDKSPDSLKMIDEVELIGSSKTCFPRKTQKKPTVLICDLGNVIMFFDRARTYRAIGHWLGIPFSEVQSRIDQTNIPQRYELGEFSSEEFYGEILSLFKPSKRMNFSIFSEFWGDIFWPNRNMIEALKLSKDELILVLLSNTNELHFTDVDEHYGDVIGLFGDRIVLSYKERMTKTNPRIFEKAIKMAGSNILARDCIYVDDKIEYVNLADNLGMKGILYFSYPQFVYSMREAGIYIP